jgi:hypothetical protein
MWAKQHDNEMEDHRHSVMVILSWSFFHGHSFIAIVSLPLFHHHCVIAIV